MVIGLLALGATFVIITGGIDLSVGTGMSLTSVMVGVTLTYMGLPLAFGVLAGVLAGALIGLINGVLISYLRIPPFIATLAMMMVAQGLALVISGTKPIYFNDTPGFSQLALGKSIPGLIIPNAVFIFFIAAVIAGVVLSKTLIGRYTYSIGSNEQATALSGINVTPLEDVDLHPRRHLHRPGRRGHRLPPELGAAGPGRGLRASGHRRRRHRRHLPARAARARSSAP